MAKYIVRDEGGEMEFGAETLDEARARAEEWVREGDWDTSGGTVYVDVALLEHQVDEDGEPQEVWIERVTVAISQDEPACEPGQRHDWQSPLWLVGGIESNPGVWGNPDGAGVIIKEGCLLCGCLRRTDTGAQRRDTGERGWEEVTYVRGHYDVAWRAEGIDEEQIAAAAEAGACSSALEWLREEPRTAGALFDHHPEWHEWAVQHRLLTDFRAASTRGCRR